MLHLKRLETIMAFSRFHAHFIDSRITATIELESRGASEVRRAFLPYVFSKI